MKSLPATPRTGRGTNKRKHSQTKAGSTPAKDNKSKKRPSIATATRTKAAKSSDKSKAKPGQRDVISGRGRTTSTHPGNRRFRSIVELHIDRYVKSLRRKEKKAIVQQIINDVRKSGAEFLQQDPKTKRWIPVKDKKVADKVGHALRDIKSERQKTERLKSDSEDASGSATENASDNEKDMHSSNSDSSVDECDEGEEGDDESEPGSPAESRPLSPLHLSPPTKLNNAFRLLQSTGSASIQKPHSNLKRLSTGPPIDSKRSSFSSDDDRSVDEDSTDSHNDNNESDQDGCTGNSNDNDNDSNSDNDNDNDNDNDDDDDKQRATIPSENNDHQQETDKNDSFSNSACRITNTQTSSQGNRRTLRSRNESQKRATNAPAQYGIVRTEVAMEVPFDSSGANRTPKEALHEVEGKKNLSLSFVEPLTVAAAATATKAPVVTLTQPYTPINPTAIATASAAGKNDRESVDFVRRRSSLAPAAMDLEYLRDVDCFSDNGSATDNGNSSAGESIIKMPIHDFNPTSGTSDGEDGPGRSTAGDSGNSSVSRHRGRTGVGGTSVVRSPHDLCSTTQHPQGIPTPLSSGVQPLIETQQMIEGKAGGAWANTITRNDAMIAPKSRIAESFLPPTVLKLKDPPNVLTSSPERRRQRQRRRERERRKLKERQQQEEQQEEHYQNQHHEQYKGQSMLDIHSVEEESDMSTDTPRGLGVSCPSNSNTGSHGKDSHSSSGASPESPSTLGS